MDTGWSAMNPILYIVEHWEEITFIYNVILKYVSLKIFQDFFKVETLLPLPWSPPSWRRWLFFSWTFLVILVYTTPRAPLTKQISVNLTCLPFSVVTLFSPGIKSCCQRSDKFFPPYKSLPFLLRSLKDFFQVQ